MSHAELPAGDMPDGFVRAVAMTALEAGVPLAVQLADARRVCLVRDGERAYAVEDRCSHRDFAISGGELVEPCVLECPWHGARFDVRTGAVLTGPAEESIPAFAVRIVHDVVFVGPIL